MSIKSEKTALEQKRGKQGFRYDAHELFETIAKSARETNRKTLQYSKATATAAAIEDNIVFLERT